MKNSFDFFDTLFTRACLIPKDLFWFLAVDAKSKGIIGNDPQMFMQLRTECETAARRKSAFEEVTIDEIYEELNIHLKLDTDKLTRLKQLEIETELRFIQPIQENLQKLNTESLILSDFYLPTDFFVRAFERTNTAYHQLLVSCEYRKTKHHGGLFKAARAKFLIASHTGDNLHSDVKMPAQYGINGVYFEKAHPNIAEKLVYDKSGIPFAVSSLLAGCMRSTRNTTSYDRTEWQALHDTVSDYVAPFLYAYVWSVIQKANEKQLTDLYFVARDGQILHRVAQHICNAFGYPIRLHYLFGSRKAWHLPSVQKVEDRVLDWLFDPTTHLSVEDVCKRAEISAAAIKPYLGKFANDTSRNLDATERIQLKELFRITNEIKTKIEARAAELREGVVQYLKQEGFDKNKNIGIVDVGWRGRQQVSLSMILKTADIYPPNGITGFYIALPHAVKPFEQDVFDTFIDHKQYPGILQRLFMYELFVTADHGSCTGYEHQNGAIVPVLRTENKQTLTAEQVQIQHHAIETFSQMISPLLAKYGIKENMQQPAILLMDSMLRFPDKKAVEAYKNVAMFEDQEETVSYAICRKISALQVFKYIAGIRHGIDYNTWLEGSVIASFSQHVSMAILHILKLRFEVVKKLKKR
jgi:predicted HAD superfamily hydrolase